MRNIVIFYHALLRAPGLDTDWLFQLLADQMASLRDSGLSDAAEKIFIGVNGTELDRVGVSLLAPKKAVLFASPQGKTELPTMIFMQNWVLSNPGWNVLYFHMKGSKFPNNPFYLNWRACMTRACIWGWRDCVGQLNNGVESCGAHWLTKENCRMCTTPIWGGNFFWATSDFLKTLPPLPEDSSDARYEAEVWIGRGPRAPLVHDFAPHFPSLNTCKP